MIIKTSLYYDARSEKLQIIQVVVERIEGRKLRII
jgi:hypothetical protein